MLNFCILASGSSGNCSVLWNEKSVILIDCGCGANYIKKELSCLGIKPSDITATVITHAHIDHLSPSGLNFLIKNEIPVYLHSDTLEDLFERYDDKIDDCRSIAFNGDFKIKDIEINPFDVYHKDARVSRTLGFSFSSSVGGRKYKIGYMTDTGKVCKNIINSLKDSNILVIESNYDKTMLDASFRPYENKRWILSDYGHLANEDAALAVAQIKEVSCAKDSLKYVFLAHLSRHHNNAQTALRVSKEVLIRRNIKDIKLFAAKRQDRCPAIKIS